MKVYDWNVIFKYADAPTLTKSMLTSVQDLKLDHLYVVYPQNVSYKLSEDISVHGLMNVQNVF